MSPTISFPGTHLAEIFSKELDFDLITYSRSGSSNGGILIQLQSAIDYKPNLILFNTTSVDRTEIPVTTNNDDLSFYTIDNLYRNVPVNNNIIPKKPKIWSNSISSLLRKFVYDPSRTAYENHCAETYDQIENLDEKMSAVKIYYRYLYDFTMKNMIDSYMMYGIIHKLHISDIPYMWIHSSFGKEFVEYPWLTEKNYLIPKTGPLFWEGKTTSDNDPGYHTTFEAQEKIARLLIEHYKNNFI